MAGEEELFEALSNSTRRDIIKLLYDRVELSYTELLNYLNVSSGLLNFHLRKLNGLIEKTEAGTYKLSKQGKAAYMLLVEAREKLLLAANELPGHEAPKIGAAMVGKRAAAFLIDLTAVFAATGALFDPQLWGFIRELVFHLASILEGHPWVLHAEHLKIFSETLYRAVSVYSHVFFAMYIFLTLLEAYKGQTLGKYLVGIRVVKRNGRKLDLVESGIRNAGKIFLLPIDLAVGILLYYRKGYLRYTDYYIDAVVEEVKRI